jgi:thioesterase domain-containing protein
MAGGADAGEAAAGGDEDLETFVQRSRDEGLLPAHVTVAQARAVRDRLRGHQAALREYSPLPIPVRVHQFPARESPEPDPTRGWDAFHSRKWLRVTPVPGTHLSMMRPLNAAALGAALSRAMDEAGAGAAPDGLSKEKEWAIF